MVTQTFKVVSKSKEICISKHLDCKSLCRIHYKKANCILKLKGLSGRAVQFKVCQLMLLPYINFLTTSQSMKSKAQWNSIVNKTGKKRKKTYMFRDLDYINPFADQYRLNNANFILQRERMLSRRAMMWRPSSAGMSLMVHWCFTWTSELWTSWNSETSLQFVCRIYAAFSDDPHNRQRCIHLTNNMHTNNRDAYIYERPTGYIRALNYNRKLHTTVGWIVFINWALSYDPPHWLEDTARVRYWRLCRENCMYSIPKTV